VYRGGYPRFLRVAVALLGDGERGRDAVQEAFVRALWSRAEVRQLERLEGWLWRTLVNVCLAELRRRPVCVLADSGELEAGDAQGGQWPELRALVAGLPARQRLVLFLRSAGRLQALRSRWVRY
jgi:DNA-directed RNA polymerase specialized sigma24 family protein